MLIAGLGTVFRFDGKRFLVACITHENSSYGLSPDLKATLVSWTFRIVNTGR